MKNSLNQNLNQNNQENIKWELIQEDFKTKLKVPSPAPTMLAVTP